MYQESVERDEEEAKNEEHQEEEELKEVEKIGFMRRPRCFIPHEQLRATQPPDFKLWRQSFSYLQVTGTFICEEGKDAEETESFEWRQSVHPLSPASKSEIQRPHNPQATELLIQGTKCFITHQPLHNFTTTAGEEAEQAFGTQEEIFAM